MRTVNGGGRMVRTVRLALNRADARYGRLFLIGLGLAAAGAALILIAQAEAAVLLVGIGVVATAVGLALLNPGLRRWSARNRPLFSALGAAAFVLSVALFGVAFRRHATPVAIAAVFFGVTGVLALKATWRLSTVRAPVWAAPVGLVLVVVGLMVVQAGGLPGMAAGAVALVGLWLYASALRRFVSRPEGTPRWVTRAGVVVVAAGVTGLVVASRWSDPMWAGAGATLLVVGLIAMSLCPGPLRDHPVAPLAGGSAAAIAGLYLLHQRLNTTFWLTAVVWLLVLLLAASFVVRGEILILVVAVGLALVWLVPDRTTTAPLDPAQDAEFRMLALGDSYIAGEGAPEFFPRTNTKGPEGDECRRSPSAYPYLLAEMKGWGLDFYACSGAKAPEVHESRQQSGAGLVPPQLHNLKDEAKAKIKVVLVSLGGNDAAFGHIGRGCVLPGSCAERRELWLGQLDQSARA